MEPKSEGAPRQAEKAQELTKVGFSKLGQSDIFERGPFTIGVNNDGRYSFYQNMQSRLAMEAITGIKVATTQPSNAPWLAVLGMHEKWGEHVSMDDPISGSSISGAPGNGNVPDFSDISGKTMEQQLTEAGFTNDKQGAGLFQRTFGNGENTVNVIAVVEDGKFKKLIKEKRIYDDSLLEKMGYEITGVGENELYGGRTTPVLRAENDALTFDIGSGGGTLNVKLKRELTPEELGITPLPETEQPDGFRIGGANSTDTIRRLTTINGQSIEELERRMRPALSMDRHSNLRPTGGISMAGFLGPQERLLDVMAADNDYVQSQGLTHQDLANQLRYAEELYFKLGVLEFTYHGRRYGVSIKQWRGIQDSPFNDGTTTNSDIQITNLDTDTSLSASLLLPDMIERYGFYEGKGASYRLAPEQIIEVFDFLKEEGQQRVQWPTKG
ncbi:MAG: hypothetical protein HYV37_03200 [Candidatus Levyibacteriota bacterium]|nr:MAG: hypothetical protein HYV37_03200 [Candidatus Levybacteria bacterium]